jgi:HEPN domain-containing protein
MANKEKVKQWIEIADKDFTTANHLALTMHPVPYEIVCFHCQQAVEKYLKGFLVFHDVEPPKIHDLTTLLELCINIASQFVEKYDKCDVLTQYGILPRYPNEMTIEKGDMDKALAYTTEILSFIHNEVPEMFKEENNT